MQKRLDTLEMMLMHNEAAIERLSQELHTQQKENRLLLNKMDLMENKLKTLSVSVLATEADETPPPHY
jgi:SlyX protein